MGLTEIRNGRIIETRILPNEEPMENIQGNVYLERAEKRQRAKRMTIENMEKEVARLKGMHK
ncbi:hypothetical protein COE51_10825 [Bacillus pseudomycoides]|nr:hypothetical protein COE51_10825 [Bacillus pseudomycoides]